MGPLMLMAWFSGLLLHLGDDSDDEEDLDTPEEPETPEEPDAELDTGASFVRTDDGVELELGDDETGSLAVIYYLDTEDNPDDFIQIDEARFYLVPEGVDWSNASWETRDDVPGPDKSEAPRGYDLENFEEYFGLELLGTVNLKGVPVDEDDPSNRFGGITANAPVEGYYLEAGTDTDNLISFLPEDFVPTRSGAVEVPVFENTVGTDGTDWLSADADDITVDGAGGDDILETDKANVTLIGGAGNDTIDSLGGGLIDTTRMDGVIVDGGAGDDFILTNNATVDGGAGDDQIWLVSGTARGGEGDDRLSTSGGVVYGDAGNDGLTAYGPGSEAHGGDGDDFVNLRDFATGYGGDGDDHLQLQSGTTGDGGAGDDLITVRDFFDNEEGPAIVTGGEGADTIDVLVRNPGGGEAENQFMRMTDFDPAEDVLQIGSWNLGLGVDEIEIIEADDGSYTDLRVTFANPGAAFDRVPGTTVIRLDGTTGVTLEHIVITG